MLETVAVDVRAGKWVHPTMVMDISVKRRTAVVSHLLSCITIPLLFAVAGM